jgi:hypothetical protein
MYIADVQYKNKPKGMVSFVRVVFAAAVYTGPLHTVQVFLHMQRCPTIECYCATIFASQHLNHAWLKIVSLKRNYRSTHIQD